MTDTTDTTNALALADKSFGTLEQKGVATKAEQKDSATAMPPKFGVCDSPAQFAKKFEAFSGQVRFAAVYRRDQPSYYGWRWHKWGPYVGEFKATVDRLEYLYEANGRHGMTAIDVQYIFELNEGQRTDLPCDLTHEIIRIN